MSHINDIMAKGKKREDAYKKIKEENFCPFCIENLHRTHDKPILKKGKSWIVTTNFEPYEGTKYHFLFIYKTKHLSDIKKLKKEERLEIFSLINWVIKKYKLDFGSILFRFGEHSGTSVNHLHYHLIVGKEWKEGREKMKTTVGFK